MRSYLLAAPFALLLACGGSDASTINAPGPDGGGADGRSPSGDSGKDGAATVDAPSSGGDTGAADAADAASATDASTTDGAACPSLAGAYGQIQTIGQGCGDLNTKASECIKESACHITLSSVSTAGAGAVNGEAQVDTGGTFSGANLKFGTVQRSGCTGSWDAATETLTLDCGGMGSSQSCVVTMTRTSATCM